MLKKLRKQFVCMDFRKNEQGFTFISMLLVLTLISISLPFLAYLTKSASYSTNYDEIATNQFFQFLRDDVIHATSYRVKPSAPTILILELADGTTATIGQYKDLIRRQVDREGHEIYLRDIKEVAFSTYSYGIRASVTTLQGEYYEKKIIFYK